MPSGRQLSEAMASLEGPRRHSHRVLAGERPDKAVAERLKARRNPADPKPRGRRAGPDDTAIPA